MNEFDKEAEREKLREKYEEDTQKREHTQRMSDLLLKGATMTNQHCDQCGDPIFRHEGQEFCPSCGTGQSADAESVEADASPEQRPPAAESEQETAGAAETTGTAGTSGMTGTANTTTSQAGNTPAVDETGRAGNGSRTPNPRQATNATERTPTQGEAPTESPVDLQTARESLARTVTKFAQAAEATDDPRRAREHLKAAREAAETVAALE